MMERTMVEHLLTITTAYAAEAGDTAARRRSRVLRSSLLGALLVAALDGSAVARPGAGYGDLIDSYCIDRGRLRVRTHQGHCAACHHLGTFDSAPEHRVEPNWTEFNRGRSGGGFDFFCPGASASAQVPTSAAPDQRPLAGSSATPQTATGTGPMGMPPVMPTAPELVQATPATPDVNGQAAAALPAAQASIKSQVQSAVQLPPEEINGRLATLHDTVGINPGQEPQWREFIDAIAAATRREGTPLGTGAPTARLKARERDLSERIAALRAAGTALSRLGAALDETQRRALSDGVAPLLDAI